MLDYYLTHTQFNCDYMSERIRLSRGVLGHLEACTRETELRRYARRQMRLSGEEPSQDSMWGMLEENSRYADTINFSSRPIGNEDVLGAALISLPPAFSSYLLDAYQRQGYIERGDVEHAYRNREFYPALAVAIVRNFGGSRRRFF